MLTSLNQLINSRISLETGPALHRLYDKHRSSFACALGILPIIIAYSRPKNIGDLTTQAKLFQAPGQEASNYLGEYEQGLDP